MKVAISTDEYLGSVKVLPTLLKQKGFEVIEFGAFTQKINIENWAEVSHQAAKTVAEGKADSAIVCCFTGTGASISANKVPGIRAALCIDAASANGARKWNNANVLAISIRLTTEITLLEIIDAWFDHEPFDEGQRFNIDYINHIS